MSKKRLFWIRLAALLVLCSALLFYPYKSISVPQWRIQFRDENGKPISGLGIEEVWANYDLESSPFIEGQETDAQGRVNFPLRMESASLASRTLGYLDNSSSPHGPSVSFRVCHYNILAGDISWRGNVFWTRTSQKMESSIVARPAPAADCPEL